MKRSLMRVLGAGSAIAAVTLLWASGGVAGQEADEREPRTRAFSILGGSGGYLGVNIAEVDGDRADEAGMSREYGAYVAMVVEDGPAADAGLEDGDVIVRWNGDRIESAAQLQRLARETPPGRSVDLTVIRDGSERSFSVELGDRSESGVLALPGGGNFQLRSSPNARLAPTPRMLFRPDTEGPRVFRTTPDGENLRSFVFSRRARLGASIQSLGDQLAEYFGVDGGALVTEVSEGSPAESGGLQAGDVIIEFAGDNVDDPGDLLEILREQEAGEASLRVVRDGAERTLTVELEEWDSDGDWEDGNGVSLFWGEGEDVSIEPVLIDGFELGPIQWEGLEMEPMDFEFDLGEHFGDGEPIRINIPRFEVPGFEMPLIEMPEIEIPGFDMRIPRMVIRV